MSEQKNLMEGEIVSPVFRLSYPNLFEARKFRDAKGQEKGEPKFSAEMIFEEGADLSEMVALAKRVAKATFGSADGVKFPFKKGEERAAKLRERGKSDAAEIYDGAVVVKTDRVERTSDGRYVGPPQVINRKGQDILDPKDIYPGCYARALLKCVAGDFNGRYVKFYLNGVVKWEDGERIAGRDIRDAFAGMIDEDDDSAGASGPDSLDDEIPF